MFQIVFVQKKVIKCECQASVEFDFDEFDRKRSKLNWKLCNSIL